MTSKPLTTNQIRSLADRVGTPLYVYDGNMIREAYGSLRAALPAEFQILYSMKANPNLELLKHLRRLGAGIDIASLGELKRAQAAGFTPVQMSFVGPGKSDAELKALVNEQLFCAVVESLDELLRLNELARLQKAPPVRVCLRVHPKIQVSTAGLEGPATGQQFGIDEDQLPDVVRRGKSCPYVKILGLHFYPRSMFLEANQIVASFERALMTAVQIEPLLPHPLEIVNFGGGFGIPYFEGQTTLDLHHLKDGLSRLFARPPLRKARYFVESGRFLVGPAGTFVTRVLYRKLSYGKTFIICDGGMTQHLAAVGIGQVIRRNYPISLIRQNPAHVDASPEKLMLAGPSCYSIDILGRDVELPTPERGDLICIGQSGAYGASFSPSGFLSQVVAQEILVNAELNDA